MDTFVTTVLQITSMMKQYFSEIKTVDMQKNSDHSWHVFNGDYAFIAVA